MHWSRSSGEMEVPDCYSMLLARGLEGWCNSKLPPSIPQTIFEQDAGGCLRATIDTTATVSLFFH